MLPSTSCHLRSTFSPQSHRNIHTPGRSARGLTETRLPKRCPATCSDIDASNAQSANRHLGDCLQGEGLQEVVGNIVNEPHGVGFRADDVPYDGAYVTSAHQSTVERGLS